MNIEPMTESSSLPLHDSLVLVDHQNIYQNEEWWKSVVRYGFDDDGDYSEVAIYLWHKDGKWSRKNKYVIKTEEAWKADKTIIQMFLNNSENLPIEKNLPVSDYYDVAGGKTVFQSNGWWKAIIKIDQKGSYETEEVMVYLWQQVDGDWRRRQKYTIKSKKKWEDESEAIEAVLGTTVSTDSISIESETTDVDESSSVLESGEFSELAEELDNHLSQHTTNSN